MTIEWMYRPSRAVVCDFLPLLISIQHAKIQTLQVVSSEYPCACTTEWTFCTNIHCLQVSAVGVWDTPLALALRAADMVTALPSAYLYSKLQQREVRVFTLVTQNAITAFDTAALAFEDPKCCSPFMPMGQLLGGCLMCAAHSCMAGKPHLPASAACALSYMTCKVTCKFTCKVT
jgi:hypothetical protein